LRTGSPPCPQPGHQSGLNGVSASADGRTAVTAGRDGTLRVWDLASGRELRRIDAGYAVRCAGAPDGRWVVAGLMDERPENVSMKVWDLATGREGRPGQLPA